MPRTNLCKTKDAKRFETLKSLIAGGMVANDINNEQIANALGVTTQTVRNYRKKPETIPYGRLMKICDLVGIKTTMILGGNE